ncbi:hypothetical protein EJ02DRAFT_338290 [Clathrospora elynae]|uniref:BRCT domain-containing protein n=1 Tax=Clathrospora elynae TaxID=706981 RepID=A0A6A5T0C0_9PLEO|nr:hypothetical protein EJ02DRAFT_338290 [Clathrospora elynae]
MANAYTRNAGSRSCTPAPSDAASSTRATESRQTSTAVAAPTRRTFFDPWNSSSTGHQCAENRLSGSTSWRVSRNLKLGEQFKSGISGGKRVEDTVGAGSGGFSKDGRKANGGWETGAKGLRAEGQKSLAEVWGASKTGKKPSQGKDTERMHAQESSTTDEEVAEAPSKCLEKHIFTGLCFYINGSTAPLVSDHKLKQLLATYGAGLSIALGRRTVTHVILGTVNSNGGAGGGLAGSKMQKEIVRTGGKAVKFVTAEWVLESIKANRCLPESRFSPLKLAHKSQNSIFGMMRAANSKQKQG